MAEVAASISRDQPGHTVRVVWSNLGNGDTGEPVSFPGAADRSVQVIVNTPGVGDAAVIQGSLEATPTNYSTLSNNVGSSLSFSTDGIGLVAENTTYLRPSVTGDGSTDITVIALFRSTMR